MNVSNRRTLRTLAIATLVTFGGASLCLLLTFAFPTFGLPKDYEGFIYLPPQIYLFAFLALLSLLLAFITSFYGFRLSRHMRHAGWTGGFVVLIVLLLSGPSYLCYSIGAMWSVLPPLPILTSGENTWSENTWLLLAAGSVFVLVLSAICALVYQSRATLLGEPLQGQK
jgi:hypothetical protein